MAWKRYRTSMRYQQLGEDLLNPSILGYIQNSFQDWANGFRMSLLNIKPVWRVPNGIKTKCFLFFYNAVANMGILGIQELTLLWCNTTIAPFQCMDSVLYSRKKKVRIQFPWYLHPILLIFHDISNHSLYELKQNQCQNSHTEVKWYLQRK